MTHRFTIVGLGEALFDIIRGEPRLGGAPLNVAYHAHQLGQPVAGRGVVLSRIGQDDLGNQLLDTLRAAGMTTDYIQTDPDRPTGRVFVHPRKFSHLPGAGDVPGAQLPGGDVDYDIVANSAWDMLWFDPEDEHLAATCDAVCFGSLAQRDAQARNAIYRFLDAARHGVKLFDVNLRQKFYDQHILRRSCELATAIKFNIHEAPIVADTLGLDTPLSAPPTPGPDTDPDTIATDIARMLIDRFDLDLAVLTRGSRGTRLIYPDAQFDGEPASYNPAPNADAVGAGDAVSAAVLVGLTMRMDPQAIADLANHLGAFVHSQPGATPALPDAILQRVAE